MPVYCFVLDDSSDVVLSQHRSSRSLHRFGHNPSNDDSSVALAVVVEQSLRTTDCPLALGEIHPMELPSVAGVQWPSQKVGLANCSKVVDMEWQRRKLEMVHCSKVVGIERQSGMLGVVDCAKVIDTPLILQASCSEVEAGTSAILG